MKGDNVSNVIHLQHECGKVSDGHHTFDELYDHRNILFLRLMKAMPKLAWFSRLHADGSGYEGWFIVGLNLPTGVVTYNVHDRMWDYALTTDAKQLERAPEWDGHTSADVWNRLKAGLEAQQLNASGN